MRKLSLPGLSLRRAEAINTENHKKKFLWKYIQEVLKNMKNQNYTQTFRNNELLQQTTLKKDKSLAFMKERERERE